MGCFAVAVVCVFRSWNPWCSVGGVSLLDMCPRYPRRSLLAGARSRE